MENEIENNQNGSEGTPSVPEQPVATENKATETPAAESAPQEGQQQRPERDNRDRNRGGKFGDRGDRKFGDRNGDRNKGGKFGDRGDRKGGGDRDRKFGGGDRKFGGGDRKFGGGDRDRKFGDRDNRGGKFGDRNRGDRDNRGGRDFRGPRENREPQNVEFDAIKNPIFCAMDMATVDQAQRVAGQIREFVGGIKVGLEYFTANGAYGVRQLWHSRLPIFLDLKFHDIPNTVAGAVRSACAMRPHMMTIHLSGGADMIKAAADAANEYATTTGSKKPLIIGVSVLTSLDDNNLSDVGFSQKTQDLALKLAELGAKNGVDGIVCSAHEIAAVKSSFGDKLKYVVPGIRPAGISDDDQKRVMSPKDAIDRGADYLVIGRAITAAPDPRLVAKIIQGQLTAPAEAA